jgi:hypothetical protein
MQGSGGIHIHIYVQAVTEQQQGFALYICLQCGSVVQVDEQVLASCPYRQSVHGAVFGVTLREGCMGLVCAHCC